MTISSSTDKVTYTGTGSTATFSYTWKIFDDDDLVVKVKKTSTLVETTLTKTTDYTVSGVGVAAGGNVVLVDADQAWLDGSGYLLSTYTITIYRSISLLQETSITSQSSFLPELHEKQFDRLIMIDQQQQRKIDQCLKLPDTETGSSSNTTLPDATTRASKGLGFDASGNPQALTFTSVGVDATTAPLVTIGNSGSLGAERALTGTANQITVTDNGANSTVVLSIPSTAAITAASLTDSGLTSGRVTIAGTAGLLEDDGGLLYDKATDILTVAGAVKTTPAAAPGTLANGQQWSDSTQIAPAYRTGGATEYGVRTILSQALLVTVANTTSQTPLLTTPSFGSLTIPANYLTVGKTLRFTAHGTFGITGTPNLTLAFSLSTGPSCTVTIATIATGTNWEFTAYIPIRVGGASGRAYGNCSFRGSVTAGASGFAAYEHIGETTPDLTASTTVSFVCIWGTASASNTLTCHHSMLEVIG